MGFGLISLLHPDLSPYPPPSLQIPDCPLWGAVLFFFLLPWEST